MGYGYESLFMIYEKRLDVLGDAGAGRGVSDMAYRDGSFELLLCLLIEYAADQAHSFMQMHLLVIIARYARRLFPSMLKCI